jgi:hypothetical protein
MKKIVVVKRLKEKDVHIVSIKATLIDKAKRFLICVKNAK